MAQPTRGRNSQAKNHLITIVLALIIAVLATWFGYGRDHAAARLAALRTEVNDPVGVRDDVEVMFDHQHRVPCGNQFPHGEKEFLDVREVKPGGRLIKNEEPALRVLRLPAPVFSKRCGEEPGELQSLGFTARECRHGLPELHILQTDIDQRLKERNHLEIIPEEIAGL